jgi:hypothetical protein
MRPRPLRNGSVALALALRPVPPKVGVDYQKWAKETDWSWDVTLAGPAEGIRQADKYTIVTISKPNDRSNLTFKVALGDKEVYSWEGHTGTVFRILRDRLYYARFWPISSGGSIVAIDLTSGKTLWESELQAIGFVNHSTYSNEMISEANTNVVSVRGNESLGRYIEVKDVGTGKTVGHRIFPRQ